MKYKCNYINQLFSLFLMMTLGFLSICVFVMPFSNDSFYKDTLRQFPKIIFVLLIIYIILLIINAIINLFIKPKIIFYEDHFIFQKEKYYYKDITSLTYEIGEFSKTSSCPDELIFNRTDEPGIVIKNPSIRLTLKAKKVCYNAKLKVYGFNHLITFYVITIIVGLIFVLTPDSCRKD